MDVKPDKAGPGGGAPVQATVWHDLGWLFAALRQAPTRGRIALIAAAIVVILIANMVAQVQLNRWNGQFFDALSAKNFDLFLTMTGVFFMLMAVLLSLVVAQTLAQELLKIELRQFLTTHLADLWLARARPYRLVFAGDIGANPDQRVQEDTRKLAELAAELVVGMTQQIFLLTTFIGVLWTLSSELKFWIGGQEIYIPGYMVWCALIYAGLGSLFAFLVGRPLVRLNAERSQKEAELRFALVRLTESAESIGFLNGEADERRNLNQPIGAVIGILRQIAFKLARLTWVTSGYGWLSLIVPVLVAAPGYFSGAVTFGGLMRLIDAFTQVQASLRWLVDNVAKIADCRAALYRVMRFEEELRTSHLEEAELKGIHVEAGGAGRLELEGVRVTMPNGRPVIAAASFRLAPGERVQLEGLAGTGKSTLLRAISGLWPWGGGTIRRPDAEGLMFLPPRPYLPLGSLREAVCYPDPPERFSEAAVQSAMQRCGLGGRIDRLDHVRRWDRDLTIGEQQRLTFARLILHRPALVIMDEATSALDEPGQAGLIRLFDEELKDSAVLFVSHRGGYGGLAERRMRLEPGAEGSVLVDSVR
ncbi:MAG TPA: ABC transporter ATP-binding protein/permease [Beijerinckiaceae bacterium]|nr:ABC transporter ATP-binding protein/permease [Beijerinckiaceae bacterium]